MPDRRRDTSLELGLDRYWDAAFGDAAATPPGDLDPSLAATVQRVLALDATSAPHPAFASALWENLTQRQSATPAAVTGSYHQASAEPSLLDRPRRALPRPQPIMRLAAAVLLAVLLAASLFAFLYPQLPRGERGLHIFAPAATPTAPAEEAGQTPLLELTLTDAPPGRLDGGLAIGELPPGSGVEERATSNTEVYSIASGPVQLTAVTAAQPVTLLPADESAIADARLLTEGQDATLETGAAIVAPPGTVLDFRNDGSAAATVLDLISIPGSLRSTRGGAEWRVGAGSAQDFVAPVRLDLRRVTLAPGETLAAPTAAGAGQAAVTVEPGRAFDLRRSAGGDFRNGGDTELDAYVLVTTIGPQSQSATAAAATPAAAATLEFLWESPGDTDDPLSRPYGLGIDLEGNIWVSDAANDRFQILAPDGEYLETWGTPGTGAGEFEFYSRRSGYGAPYGDVAFDTDGNIYVLDTGNFRVQKFAPDRSFLLAWGSEGEGEGQFLAAGGIAVGPEGAIYVSDERRSDIQKFDAEGHFLEAIEVPPDPDWSWLVPAGLTVDRGGDIWLTDFSSYRLLRIAANGELRATWGAMGSDDGELSTPNDVAVDALGRVYVADDGNNRLVVFGPDGRFLASAGGVGSDQERRFGEAGAVAVTADGIAYVSDAGSIQAYRLVTSE
jgi:DNA-binding beta-propeller fold protein YncE